MNNFQTSIWLIDGTFRGTTIPSLSEPGSNGTPDSPDLQNHQIHFKVIPRGPIYNRDEAYTITEYFRNLVFWSLNVRLKFASWYVLSKCIKKVSFLALFWFLSDYHSLAKVPIYAGSKQKLGSQLLIMRNLVLIFNW